VPDVAVLDDPEVAAVALEPTRSRLLASLAAEPGSAAQVATRLGLPRQRVGHHLRALEEKGLLVEVGRRRHGGLTERVLAASATAYLVSPAALGPAAADPARVGDRLSAGYLVAVAARAVREVGALLHGADRAGRRLPTLTVDTEVRLASAADRAAFAEELGAAVRALAAKYHAPSAPDGRWYRLVAVSHPRPADPAGADSHPEEQTS
jgi:DNA-binding transcriptional ArsR family regulator